MAVREIRAWSPATPLPNTPPHVRGVVNLRGVVLPVLDLRHLLGWGRTEPSGRHVIVVVQIGPQLQGLIVDAVNDIVSIDRDELQSPPALGGDTMQALIEGIATTDERMVTVIALGGLEIGALSEAA
ncbi:chemotaxis protein CheW [Sphingomonas nostoxanthinifaciens]|uniref:chemotaxis protein CheW n=1 Tax=Sphingomonas nostoxanthinifaciens TaxID=2872652 RepID=UPI0021DA6B4B|nr:chemotaxis protein CheW [Sphingomonas nostoxanthinifaciens]